MQYVETKIEEDERILIENVATYEHLEISLASQDPFRFIYSERHHLRPVKPDEYKKVRINYFLVKSMEIKDLLAREKLSELININGWTLYAKEKEYTSRTERN
jgi:hypothetical protein